MKQVLGLEQPGIDAWAVPDAVTKHDMQISII